MRGEREFLVSSDMKLKDFKVKVRRLADYSDLKSNSVLAADGGVQSSYLRPKPDGEWRLLD